MEINPTSEDSWFLGERLCIKSFGSELNLIWKPIIFHCHWDSVICLENIFWNINRLLIWKNNLKHNGVCKIIIQMFKYPFFFFFFRKCAAFFYLHTENEDMKISWVPRESDCFIYICMNLKKKTKKCPFHLMQATELKKSPVRILMS